MIEFSYPTGRTASEWPPLGERHGHPILIDRAETRTAFTDVD